MYSNEEKKKHEFINQNFQCTGDSFKSENESTFSSRKVFQKSVNQFSETIIHAKTQIVLFQNTI